MLHDQDPHADLFVATNGDDSWSGKLPEPNAERTDGPLASLAKARDSVRQLKQGQHRDIVTLIRGGTYAFADTLVFGLQYSAENGYSITYAAYIDIFHDAEEAVHSSFATDRRLLESAGYTVTTLREMPGFVAAVVGRFEDTVRMEWARDSAFRFFPLMEHEQRD